MSAPACPRFWDKLIQTADGCWEWAAKARITGYGVITINQQKWLAHRYAYSYMVADIPEGQQIDHLCRNRLCVNPAHLEAVPPIVNNMRSDSLAARRARMTHCPRGHEFTPDNIYRRPDRPNGSRMCRKCCSLRESRRYRRAS